MTKSMAMVAGAAILAGSSVPALAHHSFAMFDRTKEVTLEGTIKEFQFKNPHAWIQIVVPNAQGVMQEWGIECGAPAMMVRTGWKGSTLKPGDKVTLLTHPLKSGAASGSLIRVTLADGRVLGPGGPPPRPAGAAKATATE